MTLSLINDARRMYTSYSSLERRGVDRRALEERRPRPSERGERRWARASFESGRVYGEGQAGLQKPKTIFIWLPTHISPHSREEFLSFHGSLRPLQGAIVTR